jgi:hypothetical protein
MSAPSAGAHLGVSGAIMPAYGFSKAHTSRISVIESKKLPDDAS